MWAKQLRFSDESSLGVGATDGTDELMARCRLRLGVAPGAITPRAPTAPGTTSTSPSTRSPSTRSRSEDGDTAHFASIST
jgi:hypothetical protein